MTDMGEEEEDPPREEACFRDPFEDCLPAPVGHLTSDADGDAEDDVFHDAAEMASSVARRSPAELRREALEDLARRRAEEPGGGLAPSRERRLKALEEEGRRKFEAAKAAAPPALNGVAAAQDCQQLPSAGSSSGSQAASSSASPAAQKGLWEEARARRRAEEETRERLVASCVSDREKRLKALEEAGRRNAEVADAQLAQQPSVGSSSGSQAASSSVGPAAQKEESSQRAQQPSVSSGSGSPALRGSGGAESKKRVMPAAVVARMPAEARELVRKVIVNLQRACEMDCDAEQAAKFRQLNDGAMRRKVQQCAAPDKAYAAVAACLQSIGFLLQDAGSPDARWVLPAEGMLAKNRLQELLSAASATGPSPIASVDAASSSATPGSNEGPQHTWGPGATLGSTAEGAAPASAPAEERPDAGRAQASCPLPKSLVDFEVLDLGRLQGFPYLLKLFVYPKLCVQLAEASDCVAWASTLGASGHGKRREDDRVMLTIFSGFGPRDAGCASQWFDQAGKERGQPMRAWSGGWDTCGTFISHTFVLRAMPQESIDLCGFKVTGRPYDTDGHLILMLLPAHSSEDDILRQAGHVMAALPEDNRERKKTEHVRPPPPPPPGSRPNDKWSR